MDQKQKKNTARESVACGWQEKNTDSWSFQGLRVARGRRIGTMGGTNRCNLFYCGISLKRRSSAHQRRIMTRVKIAGNNNLLPGQLNEPTRQSGLRRISCIRLKVFHAREIRGFAVLYMHVLSSIPK
jgi:hypothetical protein